MKTFYLLVLWAVSAHVLWAAQDNPKFVVNQQVTLLTQKLRPLQTLQKRQEKDFQGMTQTVFRTDFEGQMYMLAKKQLWDKIQTTQKQIDELNTSLTQYKEKQELFKYSYSGAKYDYFSTQVFDGKNYEAEIEKIFQAFSKIFPLRSFSFSSRPQILIYNDPEQYLKYESKAREIKDMDFERRECESGMFSEQSNHALCFIAFCSNGSMDGLHHMLAHLLLDKVINPTSGLKEKAPQFLEEGVAEYIVSAINKDYFTVKAEEWKEVTPVNQAALIPMISEKSDFKASKTLQTKRLMEGVFFIEWLNTLPQGADLLHQLLTTKSDAYEAMLCTYQWSHNKPKTGFEDYFAWRAAKLEKLNLPRKEMSKATVEASPEPSTLSEAKP